MNDFLSHFSHISHTFSVTHTHTHTVIINEGLYVAENVWDMCEKCVRNVTENDRKCDRKLHKMWQKMCDMKENVW